MPKIRKPPGYKGDGSEVMLNPWMAAGDPQAVGPLLSSLKDTYKEIQGGGRNVWQNLGASLRGLSQLPQRAEENRAVSAMMDNMHTHGPTTMLKNWGHDLLTDSTNGEDLTNMTIDELFKVIFGK